MARLGLILLAAEAGSQRSWGQVVGPGPSPLHTGTSVVSTPFFSQRPWERIHGPPLPVSCLSKRPVFDLQISGLPLRAAARIGGRPGSLTLAAPCPCGQSPAPNLAPRWMKPRSTLRTFLPQDPAGKPHPLRDSETSVKQSPGSRDPLRSVQLSPWSPRAPARSQPGWSGHGNSAVPSVWTPPGRACALRRLQAQTHAEPDRRLALAPPGLD